MKILFLIFGFIFLGIGILGIYLPLLPATPFLLLATCCFARGSKKFNEYFISTKLYKENIEPIKNKTGMTRERKMKILMMITFFLALSFYFVNSLHARITLLLVLIFHYIYFIFKIKTIKE